MRRHFDRYREGAGLAATSWANAVEPSPHIGNLSSHLLALSLSADGTHIVDAAIEAYGTMAPASSLDNEFSNLLAATAADGPLPPPRSAFTSIFSRSAGGAFIIGGQDFTGASRHDLWFVPLGGPWSEVPLPGVQLGRVLAATFAFGDQGLWIADEIDDPSAPNTKRARLVRVDPAGGGASVVFYTPRRRPGLTPFLSVDRDGSPLLALAGDKRFALLRLRHEPHGMEIRRVRTQRGKLVRAPIVDEFGYSFVLMGGDGTLRVKRHDVLQPVACDDDDDDDDDKNTPRLTSSPACHQNILQNLF